MFNKNLLCGITISSSWEQDTTFNNKISLSSSKDFIGIPKSRLNMNFKRYFKTAEEMVNQIGIYFIDNDLGRIAGDQLIFNKNSFISEAGYHHIGGTRMGENKNISVVIKIWKYMKLIICMFVEVQLLFLVDTPITLSIIQFSLRLAKHLIERVNYI